jgi:tyrosyl-DNA phosphodiesterase 2
VTVKDDDQSTCAFSGATTRAPSSFTYVTWNIDGLDQKNLRARCKAVCKMLEHYKVDIICLQEVVPETLAIIEDELASYHCVRDTTIHEDAYFSVILVRVFTVYIDDFKVDPFPTTSMGRNLITLNCHIGKAKLCIMTAHLESTKVKGEYLRRKARA